MRPIYWLQAVLGYGKNFIGDGYRSLILSDNAMAYPYLKLTANVWNIQYSCYYSQMTDRSKLLSTGTYPRKFTIIHYLDWAVTKRLNLGLFDAIVCRAQDDNGIKRGFDFQYVNPMNSFTVISSMTNCAYNVVCFHKIKLAEAPSNALSGELPV